MAEREGTGTTAAAGSLAAVVAVLVGSIDNLGGACVRAGGSVGDEALRVSAATGEEALTNLGGLALDIGGSLPPDARASLLDTPLEGLVAQPPGEPALLLLDPRRDEDLDLRAGVRLLGEAGTSSASVVRSLERRRQAPLRAVLGFQARAREGQMVVPAGRAPHVEELLAPCEDGSPCVVALCPPLPAGEPCGQAILQGWYLAPGWGLDLTEALTSIHAAGAEGWVVESSGEDLRTTHLPR